MRMPRRYDPYLYAGWKERLNPVHSNPRQQFGTFARKESQVRGRAGVSLTGTTGADPVVPGLRAHRVGAEQGNHGSVWLLVG